MARPGKRERAARREALERNAGITARSSGTMYSGLEGRHGDRLLGSAHTLGCHAPAGQGQGGGAKRGAAKMFQGQPRKVDVIMGPQAEPSFALPSRVAHAMRRKAEVSAKHEADAWTQAAALKAAGFTRD